MEQENFMDYKDLYPMREIIEEHYLPRLKEMHRVLKVQEVFICKWIIELYIGFAV
jgi:hypothetical protein